MGNEVHAFPYRHKSIKAYQAHENALSIQYISYDMADERTHVAYGKKWIPELMKAHGIDKPVEEYIDEMVALWGLSIGRENCRYITRGDIMNFVGIWHITEMEM